MSVVEYFKTQLLEISKSDAKLFYMLRKNGTEFVDDIFGVKGMEVKILTANLHDYKKVCSNYRFDRMQNHIPIFWEF